MNQNDSSYIGSAANAKIDAQMITQAHLSTSEQKAYYACRYQFRDMELINGDQRISPMPREICICHSKQMATYFVPDKYDANGELFDSIVNHRVGPDSGNPIPKMNAADLRIAMPPEKVAIGLINSLLKCRAEYKLKLLTKSAKQS